MSTAEQLLDSMTEEDINLYLNDPALEPHIVIDTYRNVTVPEELYRIAVQHDHNIETVTFDCPRYWDGHDLSELKIYINYMRQDGYRDVFHCDNVEVDATDDSLMHFAWTISGNVTAVKGKLSFLVCAKTVDDEGNEELHWNSELNQEMFVSEGLECAESVLTEYSDIITHLLTRMEEVEDETDLESMLGYIDTYFKEDPGIQETLIEYVNQWLESDPDTQETIYNYVVNYIQETWVIDDELKLEDHPAEAKATGEAIRNQIVNTTERTINNSYAGGLNINSIAARSEQNTAVGTQLFDKNTVTWGYFLNSDGNLVEDTEDCYVTDFISVLPNTEYTVNCGEILYCTYDKDKVFLDRWNDGNIDDFDSHSFTTDPVTHYIRLSYYAYDQVHPDNLMLNKGGTPLPYEPYTGGLPTPSNPKEIESVEPGQLEIKSYNGEYESVTLLNLPNGLYAMSIPDGEPIDATYVDDDGQAWISDEIDVEHKLYIKRLGHYVFNGSESWSGMYHYNLDDKNINYFGTSILDGCAQENTPFICSHSTRIVWDETTTCFIDVDGYFIIGGSSFIDETIVTGLDFENKLRTNPIELIYPLANPIERELTDEELSSLCRLKTYDGITNIDVEKGELVRLEVQYGATDVAAVALDNASLLSLVGENIEKRVGVLEEEVETFANEVETKFAEQAEINENLGKSVSDGKTRVAGAITAKGVNTAADAEFETMAKNIESFIIAKGDAIAENVDAGVTFSNEVANNLVGTSTAKTDYANYKNAVVDGLENSGLNVTKDTTAEELQSILEAKFPASVDILTDLLTENGYTQTTGKHFDGNVDASNDILNITGSANAEGNTYVLLTGNNKYSLSPAKVSFGATFGMGSGVGQDTGCATISICNATETLASWTKTGISNAGTFSDTLTFESDSEWWVEVKVSVDTFYTDASLTITGMTAEAYSGGGEEPEVVEADVTAIVEKLNYYTGGTETTMTVDEIATKIDAVLGEITSYKTRGRNFYFYCKTITEIRNPLDFSSVTDFYGFCQGCSELIYVAPLNTSNGTDFTNLFNTCSKLVTVESIDVSKTSNATRLGNAFSKCYELQNITFVGVIPANLDVAHCTKLTLASLENILQHLKDMSGTSTTLKLTISSESEAVLIAAGYNLETFGSERGWDIEVAA